eukprot:CAMPEP_0202007042 /NCGR_PEP_ID=MMETSP0905-20130828/11632_2 /ASSEMBLY_ACC=CAM_ASM_000554 /TAXON_ID=420261 /ORGANISM="Thalassiosira antarctica, Strain CCMP982" /LENGTH=55 /DNA_ID=CAMNT_0048564917 /DNA_START=387 /DNA_END=551 /DNA_ORIENTATION=-
MESGWPMGMYVLQEISWSWWSWWSWWNIMIAGIIVLSGGLGEVVGVVVAIDAVAV